MERIAFVPKKLETSGIAGGLTAVLRDFTDSVAKRRRNTYNGTCDDVLSEEKQPTSRR
jgi:hypothetical protein